MTDRADAYLSIPRGDTGAIPDADTRIKDRLAGLLADGVKTIPGIAHRAGISFDDTRRHLAEMMTLGYFKLRTVTAGDFQLDLARPGDELVDVDLYAAISTAIRRYHARTPEQIAAAVGLPLDRHLVFAIGVTIRIISTRRQQP
jgi:hypothetical protein